MSAQAMLRRVTGLTVSKAASDRAIRLRMEATGQVNRDDYLAGMTQAELTELVELVVVPESWLFRDQQAFHVAVEFVQAGMARRAAGMRPVRILSVPCAGGEEPYSMAMALADAGVPPGCYTIDAYDLSPGCVARARSGVYGRNAFRAQELSFRDRYFTPIGNDDYLLDAAIRTQVRFNQGNILALDTFGRPYDLIFCRNLLIYFDKPTTKAAIERLSALLADDGMLFAGYAEVPSFAQNGFTPLPHRQAFALKKNPAPQSAAAVPASPGPSTPAPHRPRSGVRGVASSPHGDDTLPPARVLRGMAAPPGALPGPAAQRPYGAQYSGAQAPAARLREDDRMRPFEQERRKADRLAAETGIAASIALGNSVGRNSGTRASAGTGTGGAMRHAPAPVPVPVPADLLAQARKLADQGRHKDAVAACQSVLAAAPETAEAYFILGMLSEHARDPAQAEQHWRRCIYLQPDHYEALCHLALLAEQAGNGSGAAALKARAARIYQRQQRGTEKAET